MISSDLQLVPPKNLPPFWTSWFFCCYFPSQTRLLSSFCRPSLLAELMSEHMNNPPVVTLSHVEMTSLGDHGVYALLDSPLPCSLNLVNLRTMSVAQDLTSVTALMVMQHAGVDCGFSEVHMKCELKVSGDSRQHMKKWTLSLPLPSPFLFCSL